MNLVETDEIIIPIRSMFMVPYLQLDVCDWDNKKKKLLELMSECVLIDENSILKRSFQDKSSNNKNDMV